MTPEAHIHLTTIELLSEALDEMGKNLKKEQIAYETTLQRFHELLKRKSEAISDYQRTGGKLELVGKHL